MRMMKRASRPWKAATLVFGLSSECHAITRGNVLTSFAPTLNRLIAALCVALVMVYAATMPVKAANQIQHNLPAVTMHQHDNFDVVSTQAVHEDRAGQADHRKDDPDSQDRSGEDMAGGHHHHGDGGSSLLVPGDAITTAVAPIANLPGMGKARAIAGLRSIEPERPPRHATLIA